MSSSTSVSLEQISPSVECIRNRNVNASFELHGNNHDGKGKHSFVEWVEFCVSGCTMINLCSGCH